MGARVLLLGATGFVGREIAASLLAEGYEVSALVRSAARLAALDRAVTTKIDVCSGDLSDTTAIARGVRGATAVVSAVGFVRDVREGTSRSAPAAPPSAGLPSLFGAMKEAGVERYICLSGAAIPYPGDERRRPLDRVISAVIRRVEGENAADKFRERDALLASEVAWTAVRPGRILDGGVTGRLRVDSSASPGRTVSRGDLVAFVVGQLGDATYVRSAPFVATARR